MKRAIGSCFFQNEAGDAITVTAISDLISAENWTMYGYSQYVVPAGWCHLPYSERNNNESGKREIWLSNVFFKSDVNLPPRSRDPHH